MHQEGRARGHFILFGRSVLRGAALDHIADVDPFTTKAHGLDHFVQKLPGPPDEGAPLAVLVLARSFSHEHQRRFRGAFPENDIGACFMQTAAAAVPQVLADGLKKLSAIRPSALAVPRRALLLMRLGEYGFG
jgi:hypothetical protein